MTMKPNKTFIIRKKDDHTLWVASSGKSSWKAPNHAKAAWACGVGKGEDGITWEHECQLCHGKGVYQSPAGYERGCYKCSRTGRIRPYFNDQNIFECVELTDNIVSTDTKKLMEAATMALEALEWEAGGEPLGQLTHEAIIKLREALGITHKGG